jgi:hypothetical protein
MMPDRFTINKYNEMLEDFNVQSEEELEKKLVEDSLTLPCQCCGKEISISIVQFRNDDPICPRCNGRAH